MLAGGNLEDAIKTGAYPATITYCIDSNHSAPHNALKCTVDITGANRELKYRLTSPNTHTSKGMYGTDTCVSTSACFHKYIHMIVKVHIQFGAFLKTGY